MQTFAPEFIDSARPARDAAGERWFVDETYVKVAGQWTYFYPRPQALAGDGPLGELRKCP